MMESTRNIILCGFMGCGKTTIGQKLATLTGRRFVDMDDYIVLNSGLTIPVIFGRFGEDDFRRREREACTELSHQEGLVIAAGGGALTFSENVTAFSQTGDIVLLDVPLSIILTRLQGDRTRPLLDRLDREEAAEELYRRRLPLYRAAAKVTVDGTGSADQVACEICKALNIAV